MENKAIIVVSFMILKSTLIFSKQDSSGIYLTANDYMAHKLSLSINCKTQKHKIRAEKIIHAKEITIKHGDSSYTYPKDSLYAILKCDGSITRIYNNTSYPLINPYEKIWVYRVINRSGKISYIKYFFSVNPKDKIQELTIYNLKNAFPENHKFHDLVDIEFQSDDELMKYDKLHKIRKINRVLQNSLNE